MTNKVDSRDVPDIDRDAASPATENPASAADATAATPDPEQRMAALEAEKAQLDKYKMRLAKEMSDHEAATRDAILLDFLEVADNLERAIASWDKGGKANVESIRDGVERVLRLLMATLGRYSLTAIESKGQPFDPRIHHAISQIHSSKVAPGTVLHEVKRGYLAAGRLLRPATVVVAKRRG